MTTDQMLEFFELVYGPLQPDEQIELRAIRTGTDEAKERVFTRDLEYACVWARWADGQGLNTYYGIVPRKAGERSGRKANLQRSNWVWADLDAKDYDGGKAEAHERLHSFALRPTLVVDSGGGYQALWRLDAALEGPHLPELELVVAGLARFLESDPSVKDATRVFRVPGTHNHKDRYKVKPLVTVEYPDGGPYTLEQFTDIFPVEQPRVVPVPPPQAPLTNDDLAIVSEALHQIDPWALDYQDWVRVLMSLHSAFPDGDGLALAHTWAQEEPRKLEARWKSFRADGNTNIGTLFHFAKESGWVPPRREYGEFIWEGGRWDPKGDAPEVQGAQSDPGELVFMPLPDFLLADFPKPEWLVDQLLMKASTSLLVAKPKVGKSTLAANLAFCVGSGTPFLGRATDQGAAYVLSLDQEPGPMQAQYDALVTDFVPQGGALPDIAVHAQYALGHSLFEKVAEILRRDRPALLIVDTLAKLVRIDDGNSYSEVPKALAPYSQLAVETGTHICFLHHAHKGVADGADVTMGSVGFTGAVGTIMVLKKDPGTGIVTFEATQRWAAEVPETAIQFHPVNRAVSVLGGKDEATRQIAELRILGLLGGGDPLTAPEIKTQLAPLNEMVVGLALNDLVKGGRLTKSDGRPASYRLIQWRPAAAPTPDPAQLEIDL